MELNAPSEGPPVPPHLRTVKLSTVVHRLIEKTFHELSALTESLQDKPDQIRKLSLRDFFQRSRFRFLRLLVLVKWAKHVPTIKKCWEILEFFQEQDASLRETADGLFWLSNGLKSSRTPNYDVPTAIDVLTTGSYQRLPTSITNLIPSAPMSRLEEDATLERLNNAINMRLFTTIIPPQLTITVVRGRAYCRVEDEFEVILTLSGEERAFSKDERPQLPWRVLSIGIFVAGVHDSNESLNSVMPPERNLALLQLLQKRIEVAPSPLEELYTIMHAVCVPLQIDILNSQVQALSKSRPDLKAEYQPDKELKIFYWRNLNVQQGKQAGEQTYLQVIVLDDGKKLSIQHNPTLLDPETQQPVVFTTCPTQLDVGNLLHQAMQYHSKILLYNLYSSLLHQNLFRIPSDHITLHHHDHGKAFLRLQLLDSQALSISIDLLTGRFILLKSDMPLTEEEFLRAAESRLNKDVSEIGKILYELMRRATLEYFCRLATSPSLGLEPFHHLMIAPSAIPSKVKEEGDTTENKEEISSTTYSAIHNFSENSVYFCFKDAPDFYLAVEVAKEDDFSPEFYLLVTKKDPASKALIHILQTILLTPETPFYPEKKESEIELDKQDPHTQSRLRKSKKDKEKEKERELPGVETNLGVQKMKASNKRKFAQMETSAKSGSKKRSRHEGSRYCQALLTHLVLLCRKRITSWTIRRLFDESKGIAYKIESSGEIQFSIPCDTVMNISGMRIHFLENFEWEVLVMESHPTFNFLEVTRHTPQNVNDHIRYDKGRGWIFSYKTVHSESLKTFLRDLRGVSRMTILAKQLEDVLGPTSRFSHLQKYYQVQYFSPTYIALFFEQQTRILSILWTPEQNFVLSFSGFAFKNAHYFEFMLNTQKNMKELLEAVYCGHQPLQIISSFLHSVHFQDDLPSKPLEILPNDFIVIPRSPSQVRLIFSNICGVDIRFLPNQMVQIDDAATLLFHPSPSSTMTMNRPRHQLYPLNHFSNFYLRHILPLVQSTSTLQAEALPVGRVTHAVLPAALRLLHRFLGVIYVYRQAGPLLKAEVAENVKPEQHNNGIRFTINKMTFVICISDYYNLEMQWKETKEGESTLFGEGDDTHAESLTKSDISVVTEFFKQHVASPPYRYRVNCLAAIIRILGLPPNVLPQFIRIMSREGKIQLCLLVPEGNCLVPPESQSNPPIPGSCAIRLQKTPPAIHFMLRYLHQGTWGHLGLTYSLQNSVPETALSLWNHDNTSEIGNTFSSMIATVKETGTEFLVSVINLLEQIPPEDLAKW